MCLREVGDVTAHCDQQLCECQACLWSMVTQLFHALVFQTLHQLEQSDEGKLASGQIETKIEGHGMDPEKAGAPAWSWVHIENGKVVPFSNFKANNGPCRQLMDKVDHVHEAVHRRTMQKIIDEIGDDERNLDKIEQELEKGPVANLSELRAYTADAAFLRQKLIDCLNTYPDQKDKNGIPFPYYSRYLNADPRGFLEQFLEADPDAVPRIQADPDYRRAVEAMLGRKL
jgi:hypothetical protein